MKLGMGRLAVRVAAVASLVGMACAGAGQSEVSLSPASWSPETASRLEALEHESFQRPKPLAQAERAMVAGTTSARAVAAGVDALRAGGSAADAAVVTALTQIALVGGSYVSYAGFMTMLYYDAGSGTIHSLNAGFDTVRGENDPLTIPEWPEPSGRTALVPGFFAGVDAAHRRYGKLPWATLFEPAIYFADEGFAMSRSLAWTSQDENMRELALAELFDLLLGLGPGDALGLVDQKAHHPRLVDVALPELEGELVVAPHLLGQLAQLGEPDPEASQGRVGVTIPSARCRGHRPLGPLS